MIELLKTTNAYKVIKSDKLSRKLSHAYLIECADKLSLRLYLKNLAKLILCEQCSDYCDNCRICRLIDKETHPDVFVYPPRGEVKLNAKMSDEIVSESVIKPLELHDKVFIVEGFEQFEKSQNKLLKTLEEPPKGVILLIGATNYTAVLPTVKSRVKKLDIPPFSEEALLNYFKGKLQDEQKLSLAVKLSGGALSEVEKNYNNPEIVALKNLAYKTLTELNSSRDVLSVSSALKNTDENMFFSVMKAVLFEMLEIKNGKAERLSGSFDYGELLKKFRTGVLIECIENIGKIERDIHFNANRQMVIDKFLFSVLEAKYRWQKL
ncbi:MAG: hypothetical protein ACI4M6_02935 [Christensenellaceae bacterium]